MIDPDKPRKRDVIDISLAADGPHRVTIATAWSNLRQCVLAHTGTDIEKRGPWEFAVKTVSRTGNLHMQALLCLPSAPIGMLDKLENGFCAIFGDIPLAMAEYAANLPDDYMAAWARPLGRFKPEPIS